MAERERLSYRAIKQCQLASGKGDVAPNCCPTAPLFSVDLNQPTRVCQRVDFPEFSGDWRVPDVSDRIGGAYLPINFTTFSTSSGLPFATSSSDIFRAIRISSSGLLSGTPIFVTDTLADWVIPVPMTFVQLSVV